MIDRISNFEKQLFEKIELEKDKFLSTNYYSRDFKNLFCVFDIDIKQYNMLLSRIDLLIKQEFEQLMSNLMEEYGYATNNTKCQGKYTIDDIINYNGQISLVEYQWLVNSQASKNKSLLKDVLNY